MRLNKQEHDYKYIVGIGASAGGLEALQKLLAALSSQTGFPFIVVQHLSPDYKSLLSQILGKYTDMPVVQAEEGEVVKANHVYIIQPGKMMTLKNGVIHYTDQVPKELNLPIDAFFRSLAEDAGQRAIAVILSGTGSDGTNGIKAIKENDGFVIAQDLESSKFDGMPRSAMRTGLVDTQITPEEIAVELEHFAGASEKNISKIPEDEVDSEMMKKVYTILKKVSNINFTHYKQTTIIRRLERRMMITHKDLLSDYLDYLYESPEEARVLSKEVLIGVTSFFRDPEYFASLKEKVIPEILSRTLPDETVRAWVAGCSTGEEAYSIAILFSEVMESLNIKRAVKIFATDLDAESIDKAGKGVYGDNIIDAVSPARLSRYFTRKNNIYMINRDIRKMIVFSPHNVFQDPPFGRLDLISCRNMLIYFQNVLQNDLFAIFHQALKDKGFLFLGKSEAIGAFTEAFPVVDPAAKIFTHCRDAKIATAKKVPFLQTNFIDDEYDGSSDDITARSYSKDETYTQNEDTINQALLQKYMPASIVVNEKNELYHTYGDVSNFTHLPSGKFSNNLFDILSDGLKIPVSTLLKESREKNSEVQYTNIHFVGERKNVNIDLTVLPVSTINKGKEGLFAIILAEMGANVPSLDSVEYSIDKVASQRITDLEQDLSNVQSKLDRSIAEQECVNEELQAANEELLTANEELQSSNEELQSVNEELYTVNSEYQLKLTELNDLNDDIANFLSSTLTGIIFVDTHLNIRRYTDYVTSEFSIMDHDIGRSLAFISYHFPSIDITEICTNVLKTLVPDEREVSTSKGKMFFMRVAPYRSTENKITGCVITLMDITTQKQNQTTLKSTEKQLTMAQRASDAKSDYLSRIAHEIRTPMNSLIALAKQAKVQGQNKEALNLSLDRITEVINFMTSIVTDISEASISERLAGRQTVEPFKLKEVLENIQFMMEPRVIASKITMDVSFEDGFNPIYVGNKTKVQQILINFLNNSVKYTKEGGSIVLRAFEKPSKNDKARLCFVVSDTGVGIKQEYLSKLFKPFTRQEKGDDLSDESLGLGLSIAYNLIKSMDGVVSVESEENVGTTFNVEIYLDKFDNSANLNDSKYNIPNPVEFNLSGLNVLIAEDNSLNRTILGAMLVNEGITYCEVCDGEEAVKTFVSEPEYTFNCILMDMRMPNMDGIRATAAIRSAKKADSLEIPIIGVSANGFEDDIKKARQAGVNEYITKPIDRIALLNAMSNLIKRK